MADFASRRNALLRVIGILRVLVIRHVTRHAAGIGDVVVVVDVAIRALPRRYGVLARERKSRLRVIEIRRRPSAGRVADLASRRNALLRVIGILRVLVIRHVTRHAAGIGDVVVVVDVAIRALSRRYGVLAGQRESRLRVVEIRWLPGRGRMARLAILRKTKLHVIRIGRALEVLQVTRNARRIRDVVIVVHVAIHALPRGYGVGPSQWKTSRGMIELGVKPVVKTVALLARRRESSCHVVRVRRPLEVAGVATEALGCQAHKLPNRRRFMARVAFQCRVPPQQRKPVHVIFDLRDLYVPSLDAMALFTLGAELAFMDVSMAIGAAGSGIGEHRLGVAFIAGHRFVHSA